MMDGAHLTTSLSHAFDLKRQVLLQEWRRLIASNAATADLNHELQGTVNAMTQLLKLARPDA